MQSQLSTAVNITDLDRQTVRFPSAGRASKLAPTYSLQLLSWGIGQEILDQKLLFLQEPLSCSDLSFAQLISAFGLCYQPIDLESDWLHGKSLVLSGIPEPRFLTYAGIAPCVVNADHWPRAALMLSMPFEHADLLDHEWSIATMLNRVYQATRAGQEGFQNLELFQGLELQVEPLSWRDDPQSIINDRIPVSLQKNLHLESPPCADFFADVHQGLFGYNTGSELILWVFDTVG